MKISDGSHEVWMQNGTTARQCLSALDRLSPDTLAAMRGGTVLELGDPVAGDCTLLPISLQNEEGRRIYERSLRFVMLLALKRLYPGKQVRIEYSAGYGVFVRLPELAMSDAMVTEVETVMRALTGADLPFEKKTWTLSDAIRYFEQDGQKDKVALLHCRPFPYFNMYCCGGMWEYFYGAMAPSTGYVKVFSLVPHAPGFVLQLPAPGDPRRPAPYVDRPKHLAVFSQSAAWCEILGVVNAADVTDLAASGGLRDFIRVNEALHDKAIATLADTIAKRQRRVVLIAGPSSSGKTTFAGRLCVHLRVLGFHPVQISLDNYYINRDQIPRQPDGSLDLENINTLDLPLLQTQVRALLNGETVDVPRFNFVTGRREDSGVPTRLLPGQIVVIEGIHALNPLLSGGLPEDQIHRVFVSALTCINLDDHNRIRTTDVRLLRRIVRDHQFRGTIPEDTMNMWESVRRGEDTWIFPYQEQADSVFNTALHYELPILKHYAYDLLKAVRPDDPCFLLSRRLLKTLHYFPAVSPDILDEIPPLSLLREFIGGCTFDEK